jgi:hypothetical protein
VHPKDQPDLETLKKSTRESIETLREQLKLLAGHIYRSRQILKDSPVKPRNQQKIPDNRVKKSASDRN